MQNNQMIQQNNNIYNIDKDFKQPLLEEECLTNNRYSSIRCDPNNHRKYFDSNIIISKQPEFYSSKNIRNTKQTTKTKASSIDTNLVDCYLNKTIYNNKNDKNEKGFKKLFSSSGRLSITASTKCLHFSNSSINASLKDKERTKEILDFELKDLNIANKSSLFNKNNGQFNLTKNGKNKENIEVNNENKQTDREVNNDVDINIINENIEHLNIGSFLLLIMLSIHSIFEGIAIGVLVNMQKLIYMIFAISFHKWVEALSIVNINKLLKLTLINIDYKGH